MSEEVVESSWKTVDLDAIGEEEAEEIQAEQETETETETETKVEASEEKPKKERKSRAQERIHQLIKEREEAKAEAKRLREEMREAKTATISTKKESVKSQLTSIDGQLDATKKAFKAALEEQDTDSVLELQSKLNRLEMDKRILEAQEAKLETPQESEPEQEQESIPQEMKYWLEDNKWALEPSNREERKKVRFIRKASNELIEDGYLPTEPDFYDELDERLEKAFGTQTEDVLEYEEEDKSSSTARTENTAQQQKARKSPVAGATGVAPVSSSKKVPKPTAADIETAKKLNLDVQAYMKRKLAYEAKRKNEESGWVNVF